MEPPENLEASLETTEMAQETITVAGGCFWCVEGLFILLKGVTKAVSGYAGGTVANPSYEEVGNGLTGHAEAVQITFDPKIISMRDLFRIFFTSHDPTTLNRQGPDSGTQYRSAIFYKTPAEKKLAEEVIAEVTKERIWSHKIVTTLEPLKVFYKAEEYHQDYYGKYAKGKATPNVGYCRAVVEPKVMKFRQKYAKLLKSENK
jgi:peptide-methionine (S)-S-oxide reductase